MSSSRLRRFVQSLFVLAGVSAVAGCASMGGNMANSSGMSYYEKGNYAAAAGEFQNALKTSPSNPDYMANLAKARVKMGDSRTGEQYFRQAIMADPSHQPSYHGLAELMIDQGREQEAQAMLSTWAGTQPYIAESHVELAWLQHEMGNPQAAAQSLERALDVNPAHATALAHMGQYYEEIGQPEEAVAMYQESLQADWNQPEVHSRIAAASQTAGPESPMAATAMARGVHPYAVPRQQTAFGPPTRGAQMAQMQMMQTQMAMAGNGGPQSPMYGQMMPGQIGMNQMAMAPQMNQAMNSQMNPGMTESWSTVASPASWQKSASPMQMMPTQTASSGSEFAPMGQPMINHSGGGPSDSLSWPVDPSTQMRTPFEIPATPATGTAVSPTPDPAFSATRKKSAVTQASFNPEFEFGSAETPATMTPAPQTPATATASTAPPLVEAF